MACLRRIFWVILASHVATSSVNAGVAHNIIAQENTTFADAIATGTRASGPFNWDNPATTLYSCKFLERGVIISGNRAHLSVGDVQADVNSWTGTFFFCPLTIQLNGVQASARGNIRSQPGTWLDFDTAPIRGSVAFDFTDYGLPGFSAGVTYTFPLIDSKLRVHLLEFGVDALSVKSDRTPDLRLGVWQRLFNDGLLIGGYVNGARSKDRVSALDPTTLATLNSRSESIWWFAQGGATVAPWILTGADDSTHTGRWLREIRLAAEFGYQSISVEGDGSETTKDGYFSIDAPILPEHLQPGSDYVKVGLLAGAVTNGGYSGGVVFTGQGKKIKALEALSIILGYSRAPTAPSLGGDVETSAVGLTFMLPF